jgi:parallel beta-helix repeat protein
MNQESVGERVFSRNMSDSVARNNIISNEEQAITISESHNNEIYNNTIHDNTIIVVNPTQISSARPSSNAIIVESGAEKNNAIYSNTIINNNTLQ